MWLCSTVRGAWLLHFPESGRVTHDTTGTSQHTNAMLAVQCSAAQHGNTKQTQQHSYLTPLRKREEAHTHAPNIVGVSSAQKKGA
jgi:hypothetical protein